MPLPWFLLFSRMALLGPVCRLFFYFLVLRAYVPQFSVILILCTFPLRDLIHMHGLI